MQKRVNPFRTTVYGGLIFLIPFVVVIVVGGKAFGVMRAIAQPVARWLGAERIGVIALIDLLALVLLLVVCYLAGRVATSSRGMALYQAFDEKLLNLFPRYGFVKSMTEGLGEGAQTQTFKAALVRFDDQSQLAFEVERCSQGVVVYLPGSPDPWSGAIALVEPDRVQLLDTDIKTAVKCLRVAGRGATALLT